MPHFLIEKEDIKNDLIILKDKELLRHITLSLRVKVGEIIKFIDKDEIVYKSKIISVEKNKIEANVIEKAKSKRKLSKNIYLAQSILKGESQFLAISNAVQTGVRGIFPVISDNCAVKPPKDTIKMQKVSLEAFKQCERGDLPIIYDISPLKNVLNKFKNVIIFGERCCNSNLKKALSKMKDDILVVIGPEGGFSNSEFEYFKQKEYDIISLSPLIYKAPNAIVAGISNIIYEMNL